MKVKEATQFRLVCPPPPPLDKHAAPARPFRLAVPLPPRLRPARRPLFALDYTNAAASCSDASAASQFVALGKGAERSLGKEFQIRSNYSRLSFRRCWTKQPSHHPAGRLGFTPFPPSLVPLVQICLHRDPRAPRSAATPAAVIDFCHVLHRRSPRERP